MRKMDRNILEAAARIEVMEQASMQLQQGINSLENGLEDMTAALPFLKSVVEYYQQGEWLQDFELDEAGKLPPALKRGVLSEDQVYNQLFELVSLQHRLKALLLQIDQILPPRQPDEE